MARRHTLKAVGIVSSFTALSRGLGLVRDVLLAGLFGTSGVLSAFVVAFTIPNLFRRLFGEGALASSFVPVFIECRKKEGDEAAWAVARKTALLLIIILGSILLLLGLGIHGALQTNLSERTALTLSLLRIMLPYALLICLAALSMAALYAHNHFTIPAATPCLLNIIWILAVLLICPMVSGGPAQQIKVVAWAVLLAGGIQFLVQLPVLYQFGFRFRLEHSFLDAHIRKIALLMGPAALGLAITQVNVLIDRLLAAWIGPWAPAALFFSERLIYFPLGIFATAMSTVLLPAFARHHVSDNTSEFAQTASDGLRQVLFIMIPAAVGLMVLAGPIIQMIFEWGAFSSGSTGLTAIALTYYAPGLLVFSLPKILVPAFYARQDTRTPVKLGAITVGINLGLNLLFVTTFPTYLKHAGLALGTVLAETCYAFMLLHHLRRTAGSLHLKRVSISVLKALTAALPMALLAPWLATASLSYASGFFPVKSAQILAVLFTILISALSYMGATVLLRCPEIQEVRKAFKRA